MLEGSERQQGRSGDGVKLHNNDFYTAIVDEDLGRIEDLSKRYGSNSVIAIQGGSPGEVFWKDLVVLPLHLAAYYRRSQSMRSLLSAGADPEMRDRLGRTTLHTVIASWASILPTRPKPGSKDQIVASGKGARAEACLRLLCERHVDVNAKVGGKCQQTALHLSVRYGALSAVPILTSYGADVNAVDGNGMTPLHMAAGILHEDLIASLIKEGADVNMGVTHSGCTPLHLAAVTVAVKTTKTVEDGNGCLSKLLEQGAEVDAVNKAGTTALQEACAMGNAELVDLLLGYGADIAKPSEAGESCLFLFLSHGPNLRKAPLLAKLFGLTSPLTLYNHKGQLPKTLTQPCFHKQRDRLLNLVQQPRRLQDICKRVIYLKHVHNRREELRKVLPQSLCDFVLNSWDLLDIFSETEGELDSPNNTFDIAST